MLKKLFPMALVAVLMLFSSNAYAQPVKINGFVLDDAGLPVIGSAVLQQGTTNGAATDLDGAFALSVPKGATVEVSYIGYETQTFVVSDETTYNIVLKEDTQLLEETVVIGYGVQKKSDLTGAVASVRSEDLQNRSSSNAAAAIQGKVAGVHIINSGNPGAGSEIRVRGYSSNSGNISPLLIVDGLKVSSIQYLDPSMIESMEVLKDAASAAIYGAEAGNGVVLITTKTGAASNGTSLLTYSAKETLQNYTRRPLMNREEFLRYMEMSFGKEYVDNKLTDFDYSHPMYENGVIDTDWLSAYFEPSWTHQHSLTFSGGNNKSHFFTSLNYLNEDGVVKGQQDVYKRLTAQVNADYQLFSWLKVGTNTSFNKSMTQSVSQRGFGSSFEEVLNFDPLTPVYWTTPDEMSKAVRTEYDKSLAGTATIPYRFLRDENGWFANTKYSDLESSPLHKLYDDDSSNSSLNINGTFFANLTPFKGFTFTSRFGYRIGQSTSHSYTAPWYPGTRGAIKNYSISANANTSLYYQWENFANYDVTIAEKHNITAMAGMSFTKSTSDNVSASATGADILTAYETNFQYLNYIKGDATKTISNAPRSSAQLAYYGRLTYSYDNRYSVQANFRADAFDSSKLPASNRWGYFPSFSAGWNISNESWFKENVDKNTISFLKLRASWGRNGNISVLSGYPYATTIALGNSWYQYDPKEIGSTLSSSPNGLPNPNLTWETSEQIDLGLDARFFKNRLSFSVDYFDKRTKDLLFGITLPPELGVGSTTINGGTVLNSGIELDASWKNTIGEFSYSLNGNISFLHNEVLSLPAGTDRVTATTASSSNYPIMTAFEQGYPVWYLLGYKYEGIAEDGSYILEDVNGDGAYSTADMSYIGQGTPTFTYGLTANFAYKGLDLVIYGTGMGGNTILPVNHRMGFRNNYKGYLDLVDNGVFPNPSKTVGQFNFWSSSANAFKGDFFRIKQIQLGYTVPQRISQKALINNLRLYVSLDDCFIFTKYLGFDPETASMNSSSGSGLDWGSYPTMQKVIFGLNLTF